MTPPISETDRLKQTAADAAAAQLRDGMIVGLGSGSTARMLVDAIGQRVTNGLHIVGIPTSELTADRALSLNIPLATLAEYPKLDVVIDGADEVEINTLNLIKGGGGNHLREKIVARAARRMVVIVDERKLVSQLGSRAKLPVEISQFGWQATAELLSQLGGNPQLRLDRNGEPFLTDGANYILDCGFGTIRDPEELQRQLDGVVGAFEHGLFIGMASEILIGTPHGVKRVGITPDQQVDRV